MSADNRLSGLRILIAEDEYFLAEDIANTLTQCGALVVGPVATLAEAFELAEQPLDAAILDINLRGTLVYPLADHLASRGVRLLFATGYSASVIPARYDHVPRCEKANTSAEIAAALFPVR